MKVVHVSRSDRRGGAAIAAYRHHESMKRHGIGSKMLVIEKVSDDPDVIRHGRTRAGRFFLKYAPKAFYKLMKKAAGWYATWSYNGFGADVSGDEAVREADIVVLHWVNFNAVSLKSVERILRTGKPVYWYMHDMWPLTGGCHHGLGCRAFETHCGRCPMGRHGKGNRQMKDLSYRQFEEKRRRLAAYPNLHLISPSRWLAGEAGRSALFGNRGADVVRNVLDTGVFKPGDKGAARRRLGLPEGVKLILFGADNISSPYKGWPLLRDALKEGMEGAEAVVYGTVPAGIGAQLGIKLHSLGHISDTARLVDVYSACDVFVSSSVADTYPNVLVEALACGLPCVGTRTGGIPEIIADGVNGLLAGGAPADLREKILRVLSEPAFADRERIRARVLEENSYSGGLAPYLERHHSPQIK